MNKIDTENKTDAEVILEISHNVALQKDDPRERLCAIAAGEIAARLFDLRDQLGIDTPEQHSRASTDVMITIFKAVKMYVPVDFSGNVDAVVTMFRTFGSVGERVMEDSATDFEKFFKKDAA